MNKILNKNKFGGAAGFSIIEVLIAIFIISFGLVGIMSLAANGIRAQYESGQSVVASMLAQEGLELVRKKRDENWLVGAHWKTGIIGDGSYGIDYLGNIVDIDGGIDNAAARLRINSNGFYQYSGAGTNSSFYRLIEITDNQTDFIEVKCTVRTRNQNGINDYVASMVLYNWGN